MANNKDTQEASQHLDNRSFNSDFQIYENLIYGYDGTNARAIKTNADGELMSSNPYLYHGKKTSGDYTYFSFKQQGGTKYRIMKKHSSTGSDVSWATGASGFTAAWVDPTTLTYGEAPDV